VLEDRKDMVRLWWIIGPLALLAGCGERETLGSRKVPITQARPGAAVPDPNALTKPPRAIATH
jgi:hypothetical protein